MHFSEDEVFRTLHQCRGDNAPSLHGMTMAFLQHNWYILKPDILRMFSEFHATGKFVKSLDATFISLISKKWDAEDIRDHWPISLLGCVYKLLSKVLAIRLRGVIGHLISYFQNASIGGRQLDAIVIANELVDWRIKKGSPGGDL